MPSPSRQFPCDGISTTALVANIRKEWQSETRSAHGLAASGVFGIATAVTFSLATYGQELNSAVAAAVIVVLIIFAGLLSVPRSFLAEDELGTIDLLQLVSPFESAFLGKAIVQGALQIVSSIAICTVFAVVAQVKVALMLPFVGVVALTTVCAVGSLCLAASLAIGAQNRWVLTAVVALPLLVPTVFLAHPLCKWALDAQGATDVWRYVTGLVGLTVVAWVLGPILSGQALKH